VPRGVDLRCKKPKSTFWKAKVKKSEKKSSCAAGADLRLRLLKSTLDCRVERTLRCDYSSRLCATWGGLKMQKTKKHLRSEKKSSCAAGADLRLRLLKSTCATGVGLGATISVDLCHRSGLEYPSHGFQTQDTIAARASLKVRAKSTCVPGPWISDPRYRV
jgi:hypothetical protein